MLELLQYRFLSSLISGNTLCLKSGNSKKLINQQLVDVDWFSATNDVSISKQSELVPVAVAPGKEAFETVHHV